MNSVLPYMFKLNPLDVKQQTKLTLPEYVPPKPIHRPIYDVAPGVKVRSFYDGELK